MFGRQLVPAIGKSLPTAAFAPAMGSIGDGHVFRTTTRTLTTPMIPASVTIMSDIGPSSFFRLHGLAPQRPENEARTRQLLETEVKL
jgi:hypothetical protein